MGIFTPARLGAEPGEKLVPFLMENDSHHAKNALGAFYRRIQARCGGAKAIVATARKIAERVYRLLKYGQEYVRQGEHVYEEAYRQRQVKSMARKAATLGYKLVPESASA